MSAVAHIEDLGHGKTQGEHSGPSAAVVAAIAATQAELNRWMLWFGVPALGAAASVALALITGVVWVIGFAIVCIVIDVLVLVWLAMTSDTNSGGDESYAGGH